MNAKLSELLADIGSGQLKIVVPPLPSDSAFTSDKFVINSTTTSTDIVVNCPEDVESVTVNSPSVFQGTYSCIAEKATIAFDVGQVGDGTHQLVVTTPQGQSAVLEIIKDTVPPTSSLDGSIADYGNKHTQASFPVSGSCSDAGAKVLVKAVVDSNPSQVVQAEVLCTSSNSFTAQLNLSALAEGALTLSARHFDTAGNFVSSSKAILKDITDAAVPSLSFVPTGTTSLSQLVTSVGGTDVVSYRYKVGLQSLLICAQEFDYGPITPTANPITHDVTNLGDAPLRLCVQSVDVAGNILNSSQALQVDWIRDSGSVQVLLSDYSPAGLISNQTGVRTVNASGSEVTHYKSAVITSGTCADVDFGLIPEVAVATAISVNANASGTYQVCAIGRNLGGVWQTVATSTAVLKIDLDAPSVNIVATSPSPTAASPITFSATFSEVVTGFTADDLTVVNGSASVSGAGASYSISVTPAGSGFVSVKLNSGTVIDQASNTNSGDSTVVGVMYDSTAPAAPIVANNSYTTSSSTSPTGSWSAAADAHSGISHYQIAIGTTVGGSDVKAWTSVGTSTSESVSGLTLAEQTVYYLSVRAVDNAGNTGPSASGQGFYYYVTPTVSSISPSSGPVAGGTSITITGTNFIGAMKVWISGVQCSSLNIVSTTTMTCNTPAHTAGGKLVNVQNPANQSALVNDGFTYVAPAPTKVVFPGVAFGGADQSWVVPAGVTSVRIKMWGAGGSSPNADPFTSYGGGGAFVEGDLAVTPGETLTIIAGGYGYGGGHNAGGGRSAIRRGATELATAGGGGGGAQSVGANGGAAGDAVSPASDADATPMAGGNAHGKGATPTAGGAPGVTSWATCTGDGYQFATAVATAGAQFVAGSVGGGGGYYAGGGGMGCGNSGVDPVILGGGGGSSYVGGLTNATSLPGNTRFAGNQGDADRAASTVPNAGNSHNPGLVIISY